MRVLVTGHQGYIGSVMVSVLRAAGHTVAGLDNGFFEECLFGPEPERVPAVRKDIRDLALYDLKEFDAVIHLAALSNDPLGHLNEDWTREINFTASVNLAQLAREAGVKRFLYSSSCSIYGASNVNDVLDETARLNPVTAYALSKVRTEEALHGLASPGFSPVYMRNATAYGVSPRLRVDLVLNNLVASAFTAGEIRILSDGTPWRPIVHVRDISNAFAAALDAPAQAVHDQAFNVGVDGENYQVRDLARIVAETVPVSKIQIAEKGQPDSRSYRVDFSRIARSLPSFRPSWNAGTGAMELYDAFREIGLTREEFEGRRYIRLKQIRHLLDVGRLDKSLRWVRQD